VSAEKVADILQIYLHGARAQAANEHFDEESLLQRTAGNEQVIQKLIKKFLQNMPSQLSALKHSLQNDPKPSNWEALCHACKGPVMNVGAVKMNRLLDSLLLNIPALNSEQLLQQYEKINEAYEQLVHEFKAMGYLES
jgi:HPt (histidine-containing phosphotransfer) domain-containing protein